MITTYATVSAVEKRSVAKSARRIADGTEHGKVEIEREDTGWFIVMRELNLSLGIGFDEPEFKAGDRVRIMIEKV